MSSALIEEHHSKSTGSTGPVGTEARWIDDADRANAGEEGRDGDAGKEDGEDARWGGPLGEPKTIGAAGPTMCLKWLSPYVLL